LETLHIGCGIVIWKGFKTIGHLKNCELGGTNHKHNHKQQPKKTLQP
jgi:hypothetical protein